MKKFFIARSLVLQKLHLVTPDFTLNNLQLNTNNKTIEVRQHGYR